MPPAFVISPGNAVDGSCSGSQTRNEFITQTTEPQVNVYATIQETSQTGYRVSMRPMPRSVALREAVISGVRNSASLTASEEILIACRPRENSPC